MNFELVEGELDQEERTTGHIGRVEQSRAGAKSRKNVRGA
jgi:hypothetical protein